MNYLHLNQKYAMAMLYNITDTIFQIDLQEFPDIPTQNFCFRNILMKQITLRRHKYFFSI